MNVLDAQIMLEQFKIIKRVPHYATNVQIVHKNIVWFMR